MSHKVIGCSRNSGVSTKSGSPKPYSIASVHVLEKQATGDRGSQRVEGAGFTVVNYPVDTSIYEKLQTFLSSQIPAKSSVDLNLELRIDGRYAIVVGFTQA